MSPGRNIGRTFSPVSIIALGMLVTGFSFMLVNWAAPIRKASAWLDDFRLTYSTPLAAQNPNIVVIAIDEDTLSRMPFRSPIERRFIADLIRALDQAYDVRSIGIDLIFDQPTIDEHDLELASAMRNVRVPLVVAVGDEGTGLTPAQLAFQGSFLSGLRSGTSVLRTENGIVRTFFPFEPDGTSMHFAAALAEVSGLAVPTEPARIVFRRGALDSPSPIRVFPAHSVGQLPPGWLADKIVLIGASVADRDQHRTPLSILGGAHEFMTGVLVHAQILAQLDTGAALPRTSSWLSFSLLTIAVVAGLMLALSPLPPWLRVALGSSTFLSYWLVAFSPAVWSKVSLPLLGPSIGFVLALTLATALARQRERRQRLFLRGAFNHYVSAEIIEDILTNPSHLKLGGESREMSFLFTDIAGFSTMAEQVSPERLIELLEGYLDGVVEIALRHRGTIARFVGDGLLIFFGAPIRDDDHHVNAVKCAVEIDRFCEDYRRRGDIAGTGFGITRIGVNSGPAIVGNIGGSKRFEYTAHGDSINTASRLESANRHFGTRICLSEACAAGFAAGTFRPIGEVILKGKDIPVAVFTTWADLPAEDRRDYLEALDRLARGDSECARLWADLGVRLPDDGVIAFHGHRLRTGETGIIFRLGEK